MPATESTWRDTKLLHHIFAVSGVVLTIATIWMIYKDHVRSWKAYQVNTVDIDLKMTRMREEQYATGDALVTHERLSAELAAAKAAAIPAELLDQFKRQLDDLNAVLTDISAKHAYSPIDVDKKYIDNALKRLAEELSPDAASKRAAADDAIKAAELAGAKPVVTDEEKAALAKLTAAAREADETASTAEARAAALRTELVNYLQAQVTAARAREDKALGIRKFKSADIDAAKANLDIAIRDNLPPAEIQRRERAIQRLIEDPDNGFARLTEIYQQLSAGRKRLEATLKRITAPADLAQKNFDDAAADLARLEKQYEDQQETYFQLSWNYPWIFGKKITTLPIIDAFNSTRKIENLWSEGLMQQYGSFGNVRRFDRCTTCHQGMQKSLPNQPTQPLYISDNDFDVQIVPPPKDAPPKPRLDKYGNPQPLTLMDWLGLRLAGEGLVVPDDATVDLVVPKSPAARAVVLGSAQDSAQLTGLQLRQVAAQLTAPPKPSNFPTLPGLMVGDTIVGVKGQAVFGGNFRGPQRIGEMLVKLAQNGEPITLTIRRGLPSPYTSHPRLDLFVSDSSPHPMQTFACTICHEGQGSATDFKWASHTPNDLFQANDWIDQYGWFDNHHWIVPMNPRRFAESACLKCHHEVVELEASDKFPEAPAPKVTHGFHLIRKYGCYGCHEINGFDGPTKRVGPDLRSEPNYFAVAQQVAADLRRAAREQTPKGTAIQAVPNDAAVEERGDQPSSAAAEAPLAGNQPAKPKHATLAEWQSALVSLAAHVAQHPEDSAKRNELRGAIEDRLPAKPEDRTPLERSLAALSNLLKDVETPGELRRPGPSLRFLANKVDRVFLYDWLADPQHFRPSTRMPRFFGLWSHLDNGKGDSHAQHLEPIEIRGIIEYLASYAPDQKFEPVPRPEGIDNWSDDEKIARGKQQFEVRGCLACHTHKDFPDVAKYRTPDEIVQGPDLSAVGDKFARERNPAGPDWLYSWIKEPTRYHARTVMPNLFLDPDSIAGPDPMNPAEGAKTYDPADDIATYLLAASTSNWKPIDAAATATQPLAADDPALKALMLEYLNEAFYKDAAAEYFDLGIPPEMEGELKGAEKDLIVQPGQSLKDPQRLKYLGRKTIAKYGCFGCHDIPGFEDAKPIGTGLADWGRKDPAKLAFEHITHYIEHGHGHAAPHGESHAAEVEGEIAAEVVATEDTVQQQTADYYRHALEVGNRIGFIYQKLKEPRSYDYEKTENKRYNERLRMPQFPFSVDEREAIIAFVLGLVAEPPREKYVFQPDAQRRALIAGQKVLEKYNCGGCHILRGENWKISYNPGDFGPQAEAKVFPFLRPQFSPTTLSAAATPDFANRLHATLTGLPALDKNDALPLVFFAEEGTVVDPEAGYARSELSYAIDLWQPTILDGSPYMTGQSSVQVRSQQLDERRPVHGGTLTRYLLPVVTRLERQVNANASGSEAYGWLPPPLMGEGSKVQSDWLHDFLLDPYPIRPATFLRMPKFNMSPDEATALVGYFAAADDAPWPYSYNQTRQESRLAAEDRAYRTKLEDAGVPSEPQVPGGMRRLEDALKIVTDGNYCVKCHLVAEYSPTGSNRAKAPNLAEVFRRLRPDYTRKWIANPKMFLPYTPMPVNIAYDPDDPEFGQFLGTKVSQDLYHGNSIEQVDALVDLLMNYDRFTRDSTPIAGLVKPATVPPEGTTPAGEATTPAENTTPPSEGAPAASGSP
jgi:hypothetical protein